MRARFSEVLILTPAVVFTLATRESASTRPKKRRRASRPADARALPPPGHAGWEWNPDHHAGPAKTADADRGLSEGTRAAPPHDPTRQQQPSAASFLAERAIRESSNPPCRSRNRRRSTAS